MKKGFFLVDLCFSLSVLASFFVIIVPLMIQQKAQGQSLAEQSNLYQQLRAEINSENLNSQWHDCESYGERLYLCQSTINEIELSWFVSK